MLVNQSKKTGDNTKFSQIENKIITDHDHDKYITIQEYNKNKTLMQDQHHQIQQENCYLREKSSL